MTIRMVLADDHALFRQSLKSMLERQKDFIVVGEARNGREVVELAEKEKPDIVLMDIGMPDLNGIEATKRIVGKNGTVKVIALSMHGDGQFVSRMLKAGASGYLLKDSIFEDLVSAIRSVIEGKGFLSPEIANVVIDDYVRKSGNEKRSQNNMLTTREKEVLQLLAEGNTSKQIATTLNISIKTVENHRSQISQKLDIHSIAELTKYAIRNGLTSL